GPGLDRRNDPDERFDRIDRPRRLRRPGDHLGGAGLGKPSGREARSRDPDPRRLWIPPVERPARLGRGARGSPVDPRLRLDSLLLHVRQFLFLLGARVQVSASQEARLSLLGWSFRGAGVSVRERVAFTADEIREALTKLASGGVISEGVIVSTCHRSEIYSFAADDKARAALTRFVSEWRGLDQAELQGSSFYRSGGDAARHLFRVAAGLPSLRPGGGEGLRPGRRAPSLARESATPRA